MVLEVVPSDGDMKQFIFLYCLPLNTEAKVKWPVEIVLVGPNGWLVENTACD